MKQQYNIGKVPAKIMGWEQEINFKGYPIYPAGEDIYVKFQKEVGEEPLDVSEIKEATDGDKIETGNRKDYYEDMPGYELDVPGAELDDIQENIGNEDDENNYYSLGNDKHLEEDND